jgi:hypothetical protein
LAEISQSNSDLASHTYEHCGFLAEHRWAAKRRIAMATTETLVNFVMDTNYGDFPDGVAEAAKNLVLDCLGAMLFGVREEASQMVIRYAKASGGVPEVGGLR